MKTSLLRILSPVLFAGLASLSLVPDTHARVFVATNSTWSYFKGTNEASTPTNAWRQLDFDDSAWLVGAGPFHFGTNAVGGDDTLTGGTILSDMRSNYTCFFLRQRFELPDTNNVRGLWLNAWFDDGLAVWINGQAARNPISVGALAYTNTATSTREGSARNAINLSTAVSLLRPGSNVLCLQVFNRSLTDDDFRIDVELAETPPTLALAAAAYTVLETVGQLEVRVIGTGVQEPGATVDYATTNLTATAGVHYTAVAGTLSFAPGETNQTLMVPILNAAFAEGTKTFQVLLRNSINAVLGTPTTATVSITDNDVGVQFVFATYSVAEDAGAVLVGVVRGDDGTLPVTVDLATTDLTATSGLDYAGTTNTLSFAGTERFKLVPVPILNDSVKEVNKTFRVTLTNPAGATLGSQTTTTVTIVDNDQGLQFEAASYTVAEDAGAAFLGVLRGDDGDQPVTVDYATADGTATQGLDYTATSGTLCFAAGEKVKPIAIPILNDGVQEAAKNFRVALSNPSGGATLGSRTNILVSIQDNDPGVGFELATDSVFEKAGQITLTVLRGNDDALGPITVDYATADGTARAGTDYQAVSGTLEFQEQETVESLTIPILGDAVAENTETFSVTLSHPTGGAVLGRASVSVQILDNYYTLVPPYDAGLTIRREASVNLLNWTGDGILQRADRVTGPWQTIAGKRSPVSVESPLPMGFYRIKGSRPVNLYVPSGYDGQTPLPLVILLHGYGNSGQGVEDYMQLRPLAESRRFLYCYPDGTLDLFGTRWWNAYVTNAADASAFGMTTVDDVGYLRGLIEEVARHFALDRKRVHLIGHSNGGFMSYRMACESADIIAGIASLAGMSMLDIRNCQPSEPVNILHMHGTADVTARYLGGAFTYPTFPFNSPAYAGAVQQVQTWAGCNGASNPVTDPAPSMDLDLAVAGLETVVTRYTIGPPGGAVELWTITGGGHRPTFSSEFAPRVIDWLLAHPKP